MSATVIPFPPRPVSIYHAHCDECALNFYHWRVERVRRWAKVHARSYGHTTRTPDGLVFNMVNGHEVAYP